MAFFVYVAFFSVKIIEQGDPQCNHCLSVASCCPLVSGWQSGRVCWFIYLYTRPRKIHFPVYESLPRNETSENEFLLLSTKWIYSCLLNYSIKSIVIFCGTQQFVNNSPAVIWRCIRKVACAISELLSVFWFYFLVISFSMSEDITLYTTAYKFTGKMLLLSNYS